MTKLLLIASVLTLNFTSLAQNKGEVQLLQKLELEPIQRNRYEQDLPFEYRATYCFYLSAEGEGRPPRQVSQNSVSSTNACCMRAHAMTPEIEPQSFQVTRKVTSRANFSILSPIDNTQQYYSQSADKSIYFDIYCHNDSLNPFNGFPRRRVNRLMEGHVIVPRR